MKIVALIKMKHSETLQIDLRYHNVSEFFLIIQSAYVDSI